MGGQASTRIAIEGLAPLLQVFDIPTSVGFYPRDPDGYEIGLQWPMAGQGRG